MYVTCAIDMRLDTMKGDCIMTVNEIRAELEGVLGSAKDNFPDVRCDVFTDEEVREEADLITTLEHLLDIWPHVVPYLGGEEV